MRSLVTGVAGFVGSTLAERLIDLGHDVVGVDRFSPSYARDVKESNLARLRLSARFRLFEIDLASSDLAAPFEGVDVVFHQAAQAGVRKSWRENFADYTRDNVLATQRVLEASRGARVKKVITASSSSVYGQTEDLPMRETSLPKPYSPYGVTKLAAEHLAELYRSNFGLETVSLRYFTVYGPRQRPDMAFHGFIDALARGEKVTVFGDGEQTRDFTFVSDAVDANVLAMNAAATGVFNIGGGSRVSVNHVLATLARVMDVAPPSAEARVEHRGEQAGDVRHTSADTTRAAQILGFTPKTPLEEGLRAQVAWQLSSRRVRS